MIMLIMFFKLLVFNESNQTIHFQIVVIIALIAPLKNQLQIQQ